MVLRQDITVFDVSPSDGCPDGPVRRHRRDPSKEIRLKGTRLRSDATTRCRSGARVGRGVVEPTSRAQAAGAAESWRHAPGPESARTRARPLPPGVGLLRLVPERYTSGNRERTSGAGARKLRRPARCSPSAATRLEHRLPSIRHAPPPDGGDVGTSPRRPSAADAGPAERTSRRLRDAPTPTRPSAPSPRTPPSRRSAAPRRPSPEKREQARTTPRVEDLLIRKTPMPRGSMDPSRPTPLTPP